MTEPLPTPAFWADFGQVSTVTGESLLSMRLAFAPTEDEGDWIATGTATISAGPGRPAWRREFTVTGMLALSPEPTGAPVYDLRVRGSSPGGRSFAAGWLGAGLSVELSAVSAVSPSELDILTFHGEYLCLDGNPVVVAGVEVAMTAAGGLDAA